MSFQYWVSPSVASELRYKEHLNLEFLSTSEIAISVRKAPVLAD